MEEAIICWKYKNMAVVYRFVIDSNDDGRATILVTNQLIETMGVTPEQLHADALENAPELKPAVIKGMSEVRFTMRNALEELVDNSLMALRDVEFTDSNGNLVDWKNLEVR